MARPGSKFPTELELQILKLHWKHGELAVRNVRELLREEADRDLAHTSVVTTLNTMVGKGYLDRRQDGNAYVFSAAIDQEAVSSGMLNDVLQRVFDGSARSLVLSLLESEAVSDQEHQELRELIDQSRESKPKNSDDEDVQ